jgi:hypothetical protein
MRVDKFIPRCRSLSRWRWFDAVFLKNVAHRLIANGMPQIAYFTGDPVVTPFGILPGHAQDQPTDLVRDRGPANRLLSTLRVVPLLRHQLAVPAQDRVGGDDGGQFEQCFAADPFGFDRQASTIVLAWARVKAPGKSATINVWSPGPSP